MNTVSKLIYLKNDIVTYMNFIYVTISFFKYISLFEKYQFISLSVYYQFISLSVYYQFIISLYIISLSVYQFISL